MLKKQVKCSECGFLGVLGGIETWGEIPSGTRSGLLGRYMDTPLHVSCLRGQNCLIAGVSPGDAVSMEVLIRNSYLPRKCTLFYRYNPGYAPDQHLELLRDSKQRRFLIVVSIISAAVGAGMATLANLVWS